MRPTQEMFKDLPPKFKYIGQDKDGTIAAYTHKPFSDYEEWHVDYIHAFSEASIIWSPEKGTTLYSPNWENSLIKRGEE